MTTLDQTRAIHATLRQLPDFTDSDYRALLRETYGVASSTRLNFTRAAHLIGTLKGMAGKAGNGGFRRDGSAAVVTGPYARALQALWIAAYNLGIVEDRHDRALLAFVTRQTGLSHTRFLTDPADGAKAVEGLKAWIARETGVAWAKTNDALARKRAVVEAQTAIMRTRLPTFDPQQLGALEGFGARLADYDAAALDRLSAAIGKMIRRDRAKTAKGKAA